MNLLKYCLLTLCYQRIMNLFPSVILFFTTMGCIPSGNSGQNTPSFPGAEGAGMYTSGGRGGIVVEVSNLEDSGAGSLRAALNMKECRTVIFKISGTIELKSPVEIKNGNLTIAGQTAPGDGICVSRYPVIIKSGNVIIRYMRFRLGDTSGEGFDAINCKDQEDVIIDHCSMSWSVDETASFYDNKNFTLQWCIISESLNNSVHKKGEHGYGGIWGGMNASFHHNLLANHASRNPRFQGSRYHKMPDKEMAEFTNNVIYNWGHKSSYGGEEGHYNMIANYYKPGPATKKSQRTVILEPFSPLGSFYLEGNILEGSLEISQNNSLGIEINENALDSVLSKVRFIITPAVKAQTASEAFSSVTALAGASLKRDITDQRIIDEVINGSCHFGDNGIINSQQDVGGWPQLETMEAPADSDHDGMPDLWEKNMNLDPTDPTDGKLYQPDNIYTNLELYLNSLTLHEKS
ncbi:MAG: pectate lyase [Bacteroidales bacterium]|nr:pectate lyase [Bacteroidales bacterium]MCB9012820.1 pectate lyase [Bacteroidales bacterium]